VNWGKRNDKRAGTGAEYVTSRYRECREDATRILRLAVKPVSELEADSMLSFDLVLVSIMPSGETSKAKFHFSSLTPANPAWLSLLFHIAMSNTLPI
jgi:hypothetical protein